MLISYPDLICIYLLFYFLADKTPAGFPTIVQGPVTRVIEIGHTAVLQCKATGNPSPKIHWYRDMKRVDMINPRYALLDGKSSLLILLLLL